MGEVHPLVFRLRGDEKNYLKGDCGDRKRAERETGREIMRESKSVWLAALASLFPISPFLMSVQLFPDPVKTEVAAPRYFPNHSSRAVRGRGSIASSSYAGISICLAERGLVITHRGTALMEAGHREELLPFPSWRSSLSLEPFIRPCSLDI